MQLTVGTGSLTTTNRFGELIVSRVVGVFVIEDWETEEGVPCWVGHHTALIGSSSALRWLTKGRTASQQMTDGSANNVSQKAKRYL